MRHPPYLAPLRHCPAPHPGGCLSQEGSYLPSRGDDRSYPLTPIFTLFTLFRLVSAALWCTPQSISHDGYGRIKMQGTVIVE